MIFKVLAKSKSPFINDKYIFNLFLLQILVNYTLFFQNFLPIALNYFSFYKFNYFYVFFFSTIIFYTYLFHIICFCKFFYLIYYIIFLQKTFLFYSNMKQKKKIKLLQKKIHSTTNMKATPQINQSIKKLTT